MTGSSMIGYAWHCPNVGKRDLEEELAEAIVRELVGGSHCPEKKLTRIRRPRERIRRSSCKPLVLNAPG